MNLVLRSIENNPLSHSNRDYSSKDKNINPNQSFEKNTSMATTTGSGNLKLEKGTKLFLDLKGYCNRTKLEAYLKKLEVSVEEFLSNEINFIVTNRKLESENKLTKQQQNNSFSSQAQPNVPKIMMSRGQALLMRSNSTNSLNSHNCIDPVQFATKFNIPVVEVGELKKVLKSEMSKLKSARKAKALSPNNFCKKLNKDFIKVEDDSQRFAPFFRCFKKFPNFKQQLQKSNEKQANNNKKNAAINMKLTYCECCDEVVKDLSLHNNDVKHLNFSKKVENYLSLDQLISSLPSLHDLVASFTGPHSNEINDSESNMEGNYEKDVNELGTGGLESTTSTSGIINPIECNVTINVTTPSIHLFDSIPANKSVHLQDNHETTTTTRIHTNDLVKRPWENESSEEVVDGFGVQGSNNKNNSPTSVKQNDELNPEINPSLNNDMASDGDKFNEKNNLNNTHDTTINGNKSFLDDIVPLDTTSQPDQSPNKTGLPISPILHEATQHSNMDECSSKTIMMNESLIDVEKFNADDFNKSPSNVIREIVNKNSETMNIVASNHESPSMRIVAPSLYKEITGTNQFHSTPVIQTRHNLNSVGMTPSGTECPDELSTPILRLHDVHMNTDHRTTTPVAFDPIEFNLSSSIVNSNNNNNIEADLVLVPPQMQPDFLKCNDHHLNLSSSDDNWSSHQYQPNYVQDGIHVMANNINTNHTTTTTTTTTTNNNNNENPPQINAPINWLFTNNDADGHTGITNCTVSHNQQQHLLYQQQQQQLQEIQQLQQQQEYLMYQQYILQFQQPQQQHHQQPQHNQQQQLQHHHQQLQHNQQQQLQHHHQQQHNQQNHHHHQQQQQQLQHQQQFPLMFNSFPLFLSQPEALTEHPLATYTTYDLYNNSSHNNHSELYNLHFELQSQSFSSPFPQPNISNFNYYLGEYSFTPSRNTFEPDHLIRSAPTLITEPERLVINIGGHNPNPVDEMADRRCATGKRRCNKVNSRNGKLNRGSSVNAKRSLFHSKPNTSQQTSHNKLVDSLTSDMNDHQTLVETSNTSECTLRDDCKVEKISHINVSNPVCNFMDEADRINNNNILINNRTRQAKITENPNVTDTTHTHSDVNKLSDSHGIFNKANLDRNDDDNDTEIYDVSMWCMSYRSDLKVVFKRIDSSSHCDTDDLIR